MSFTKHSTWLWMVSFACSLSAVAAVPVPAASGAPEKAKSQWVYPGPSGRLVYNKTPTGDQILDFSHAGYRGGGVALPSVPVKQTVKPTGSDDDTTVIQRAIDAVSALPMGADGFRGAVLLAPGTFTCADTITIVASGVVLRGSGSEGGQATTIKLSGKPHLAIAIRKAGAETKVTDSAGGRMTIMDRYVPSGARSFSVTDTRGLAVGDAVSIQRPVTESWLKFMQMHDLVRDGRPQTWIAPGKTISTERRIAAVSGNKITLDVPVTDSYDAQHTAPQGAAVVKIKVPDRITESGIEHLRIVSPPQAINHTQPNFTALRINGQDCWARDLVIEETMNSVTVNGRRITLERVAVIRKARHQGSSRPAEFAPNGGQVLIDRCSVTADNVWFVATGGGQAGPNVVLNCKFEGTSRAESHQRWSTGLLYDNCQVPEGGIEMRNRGSMGSGHGWSMGWGVIWNCSAKDLLVQNPPGAYNWLIGSSGNITKSARPFGAGPTLSGGIVDSPGKAVAPQSLYLAQLQERLGPQAVKNIGY